LVIEKRIPRNAAIGCLPDTSSYGAEVKGVGLSWHAGDGKDASSAEGANEAPLHAAVGFGIDLGRALLGGGKARGETQDEKRQKNKELSTRVHTHLREAALSRCILSPKVREEGHKVNDLAKELGQADGASTLGAHLAKYRSY
jgi:hypothetical protein